MISLDEMSPVIGTGVRVPISPNHNKFNIFREPFGLTLAIAFGFIWLALAVFTIDSMMGEAKARRLARAARPV